jgi:ABC-type glycerol-3-phosphate transport system substrate-binding protein
MSNEQQQNNSLNVEDGGESSTSSSSSCNDNCIHCPQNITILFEGDEFRRYLENHITNYKILRPNIHIQLQEVVVSSPSTSTSNTSSLYGGSELSNAGESLISYVLNGRNGNHDNNNHGNDKATWDGILFPAHWIGELVESNILWDLSDYVQEQLNVIAPSPSRSLQDQSSTITATIDNNQSLNLDWPDIQPFIRSQQATFNGQVLSIPLDGDIISLYYNRDLFDQHQIQVPKTWEEYLTVAQYFHGKPWGPNGTSLHGSCISRLNHCANYYWTALILSTMTQSTGSGSGFLLHPTTVDPLLGDAMMETLKIVADQSLVGPNDELPLIMKNATTCMEVNYDLNSGTCAMTYNWGNQIGYSNNQRKNNNIHNNNNNNNSNNNSTARNYRQQQQRQQQKEQPNIGVAPTPGSTRVLNRNTYQLEDCTPELCPYGIYYDDIGRIVNRPSYSAFGGWQGGVSHTSPTRNQYAVADFFSYMSYHVQSFYEDVVPNNRSTFVNPYRYSHLMPSSWNTNTTTTSLDTISALQFTDSVGTINSQNTVMDIRIRPGKDIRTIIDEEVYDYLMKRKAGRNWTNGINSTDDIDNTDDDEEEEDALVRKQVTARMDGRIQQIIASSDRDTVLRMYQASLGITNANTGDLPSSSQPSSMNGIDPKYRSASWGVSGLICCTSLALILWTLWYRRNKVMQAFQPYLLIQCAVGLFFMGATIIPLGLDDTIVTDTAILDVTCMASPWIYVVGFSLFFSSIYSKIRLCIRIFHSPEKNDVMAVQPMNALKGSVRVLLLNSVILFLWTLVDPLQWVRVEVPDGITYSDGTVETYGACRGDTFSMLLFVLCLFFLNLILCLIGIYQAFQCRFLILEYNEMQWLPLSIFPFFEAWVCGCPILFFVQEDPTTTFLVLTIVISVSCIASALAVFAPKDWYVRKFRGRDGGTKGSQITSRSTPAGVLVLKHPTVRNKRKDEPLKIIAQGTFRVQNSHFFPVSFY